jgi:hypothetical protein
MSYLFILVEKYWQIFMRYIFCHMSPMPFGFSHFLLFHFILKGWLALLILARDCGLIFGTMAHRFFTMQSKVIAHNQL